MNLLTVEELKATTAQNDAALGPATHCCPVCGFTPYEGMQQYLRIHWPMATCVGCRMELTPYFSESKEISNA